MQRFQKEMVENMDKWISVKDRLPEPLDSVIFYAPKQSKDCSMDIGEGFIDSGEWCSVREDIDLKKVTHWMPLPEPPKKAYKVIKPKKIKTT